MPIYMKLDDIREKIRIRNEFYQLCRDFFAHKITLEEANAKRSALRDRLIAVEARLASHIL